MANNSSQKKNIIAIVILSLILVAAVIGIGIGLYNKSKPSIVATEEDTDISFTFYEEQEVDVENLSSHNDVGVMIIDGDDQTYFDGTLKNASVTRKKGEYVQGTGALAIGSFASGTSGTVNTYGCFEGVDISNYAEGSIHVSLYVSDTRYLGDTIIFELSSSGHWDVEEICWFIPPSVLKQGWNDLYLSMEDKIATGGDINLKSINFFRMFTSGTKVGLDVIIDCVYATNTAGMSLEKQAGYPASTKAGYLMDCDTLDGISSSGRVKITKAEGEYKEGKGAILVSNPDVNWVGTTLKTADISAYENGKLTFWLYVNKASYVKDGLITVELSSSGTWDQNEITWWLNGSDLKTGWNEVSLSMLTAVNSSKDRTQPIDLTKVNFFRIFGENCSSNLVVILDALRVVPATVIVPANGMILDCDSQENMEVTSNNTISVTNKAGEYKEGTGAFKNEGSGTAWWQVKMFDVLDISKYADGGIHLWLYVSDTSKLSSYMGIELGSGGKWDVNEYQWNLNKESLSNGWNELYLNFSTAAVTGGEPTLSAINWFRIYAECSGDLVAMVDDVHAVSASDGAKLPVISACDSMRDVNLLFGYVTAQEAEHKEGTGAFKSSASNVMLSYFKLIKPVDITEYLDGYLHIWFYIDKPEDLSNSLLVDIGNNSQNYRRWIIKKDSLESGWNELYLDLEMPSYDIGKPDLTNMDYFKIHQEVSADKTYKKLTAIVDDVRLVKPEDIDVNTTDGIITTCDDKFNVELLWGALATAEGEFKEGTGAYKSSGANVMLNYFTLKKAEDITAYKEGYFHLWYYIDKPEDLTSDLIIDLGNDSKHCRRWVVEKDNLVSGWNELYLDMENPEYDVKQDGVAVDFTAVDFFKVHQNPADTYQTIVSMVDDIRMVKAEDVTVTREEGVISDCDDTAGMTLKYGQITTVEKEHKEGTGAFISTKAEVRRCHFILKDSIDITEYLEGYLHLWFYIDKPENLSNSLLVDIGNDSSNYRRWVISKNNLKSGWNELYLDLVMPSYDVGKPDFTDVDYFKIHQEVADTYQEMTTITDDIRLVKPEDIDVDTTDGIITTCDDKFNVELRYGSVTKVEDEFKEGTGAYKASGANVLLNYFTLKKAEDITAYENGYLHLWYYIDKPEDLTSGLIIDIGNDSSNCRRWIIQKEALESGWNEFYLDMENPAYNVGTPNFAEVDFFKIHQEPADAYNQITSIVDDIRMVAEDALDVSAENGVILSGDSRKNMTLTYSSANQMSITTTETEYKVGSGAFKSVGTGTNRWATSFITPVDISGCNADGIHVWLYVDDPAKIDGAQVHIELGSSGKFDVNEYEWVVGGLSKGWNELLLDFESAGKVGTVDLTEINWFRVFATSRSGQEATMMVDDVRAVEITETEEVKLPGKVISNCESTSEYGDGRYGGITTESGKYKEGTGAFIATATTSDALLSTFTLTKAVDMSDYTDGYLHLWLYIDKPDGLNQHLAIDIGNNSSNCHRWYLRKAQLESGWNELYLSMTKNKTNELIEYNWSMGTTDWSNVTYFKLHSNGNPSEAVVTIVDDIRAVHSLPDKMITNCDNKNDYNNRYGTVTTESGKYKEGTGAFIATATTSDALLSTFTLTKAVDMSDYTDGYLHLWLYIDKPDGLNQHLAIDIGNNSSNCHRWYLRKAQLESGWNELYLSMTKNKTNELIEYNWSMGTTDWSNVTYFKLHSNGNPSEAIVTIADDIRVAQVPDKIIANCDSKSNVNLTWGSVATGVGEYKEGTGAFKSNAANVMLSNFTLSKAVNLSEYVNGYLHLSVYIDNPENLCEYLVVDIGSSSSKCHRWYLKKGQLESGWNELYLDLTTNQTDTLVAYNWAIGGDADWNNVTYFKLHQNPGTFKAMTVIVDDIRAVIYKPE